VLYPKDDQGNVHRFCKDNAPMKVVLVANKPNKIIGSVYSSETTGWSDVSTTDSAIRYESVYRPSFLAGNTIHWLLHGSGGEIQFDLDTHRLSWIKFHNGPHFSRLIHSEDGSIRLASLVGPEVCDLQNLLELEAQIFFSWKCCLRVGIPT
jgi:hypothetical protein